jgi:hypothetical protein
VDRPDARTHGLAPFAVAVRGTRRAVAGMGLAVDRTDVVTPAYVINRALGRYPAGAGASFRGQLIADSVFLETDARVWDALTHPSVIHRTKDLPRFTARGCAGPARS